MLKDGMRLLFVIGHLGDYHVPRYEALLRLAASRGDELFLTEVYGRSGVYTFPQTRRAGFFARSPARLVTLENDLTDAGGRALRIACKLARVVRNFEPDVVVTLGYNTSYSLWLCILRHTSRRFSLIYMSDSKADDGRRSPFKESLKRILVRRFDGALVAGQRHRAYAQTLGIPLERSRVGFDVIDVAQFSRIAEEARASDPEVRSLFGLPQRYVLCVSRFIARKNVDVVVDAFARSQLAGQGISLLLVGQGPGERALRLLASRLQVGEKVCFMRPVPNSEMAGIYALSEFVVLASEFDQWGLCVNEAFAAARTAIVTATCGAAGELVLDNINGFIVKPGDTDALAERMRALVLHDAMRERLSKQARETVARWSPAFFASNLMDLADYIVNSSVRR